MIKGVALSLIKAYQLTWSQVTPSTCRFVPTCSHYAYQAINKFGIVQGCWLTLKRLSRCHPFHPGGYDPVP